LTSHTSKKKSAAGSKNSLGGYPKGARKLILTAERLFGQFGFDNVSLRQIVTASGQANNFAVQHHFGSKEGLIEAIFTIRMAVLDAARGKFLQSIKQSGELTAENIIKAIMIPILEAFDEQERQLYADFMFHLFHHKQVHANAILSGDVPEYAKFAPAVNELNTLLRKELKHLPAGVFNTRYRLSAELFLSCLNERKRMSNGNVNSYPNVKAFWKDMLKLTMVVFTAPYP
jgi:AcrR family transcriptional regulator